jgi:hypothetical protein
MFSLVPLAQSVAAPISELKSADGLVGSHFNQARNYVGILSGVAENLAKNIKLMGKYDGVA